MQLNDGDGDDAATTTTTTCPPQGTLKAVPAEMRGRRQACDKDGDGDRALFSTKMTGTTWPAKADRRVSTAMLTKKTLFGTYCTSTVATSFEWH